METGRIFDTKEFAVYDGEGIRVTYFLQGCPLRCEWCHNPEGQLVEGGRTVRSIEIIDEIRDYAVMWKGCTGGVTFSGGEPLMQEAFLAEIMDGIGDVSKAIETSAAVRGQVFQNICRRADFVYVDLKLMDEEQHRRYTGISNRLILDNIRWLAGTDIPCTVRIPMIPGVNATEENYRQTAEFLAGLPRKLPVELLPYNTLTRAKYDAIHKEYRISFDEEDAVCEDTQIFTRYGILCGIL